MIDKRMYEVAVDMLTKLSTGNADDEMLQVGLATTMLKAATESHKSEATMFKCLGYAGLIIHRYEEQNNLCSDSPTTTSTNPSTVGTLDNK